MLQSSVLFALLAISAYSRFDPKFDKNIPIITKRPFLVKICTVEGALCHCSGTIIRPYWVVTSANCLHSYYAFELNVRKEKEGPLGGELEITENEIETIALHDSFRYQRRPAITLSLIKVKEPYPIEETLPLCEHFPALKTVLGASGYSLSSDNFGVDQHEEPLVQKHYQETYFYQSLFKYPSLDHCAVRSICTEPLTNMVQTLDEGSPLFILGCPTDEAVCLYGVLTRRYATNYLNKGGYAEKYEEAFISIPETFSWLQYVFREDYFWTYGFFR
ncbi:uncharacterized protein LOC142340799 [Convolutriloba macropyga]|uniref:uncharacterized protein LOC142340799 n=1 Tax=Convolutriloba macropyga TaxID=536237 RepID=UPI003F51C3E7